MPFQFSGHPKYLVEAGCELKLPVSVVDRSRRQPAVGECANLLSQAIDAHPAHRREILSHARERVEALAVAHKASLAMYDEVVGQLFPPAPAPVDDDEKEWAEFKAANHGVEVAELPRNQRPPRRQKA